MLNHLCVVTESNNNDVKIHYITLYNVNILQAIVVSAVTITIVILINVTGNYFLNKDIEKIHPSQFRGFFC